MAPSAPPIECPSALISDRIPSLDGLRGLSIIMVLVGHLNGTDGFPNLRPYFMNLDVGALGVSIFFVISGLLITKLLFEDHQRTGKINLLLFYLRRTFRIFPAYFTLIAVIAIAANAEWIQLDRGDLRAALTYTMNYHPDHAWSLAHTWSLSMEEQFYLIWPLALLLLGARWGLVAAGTWIIAAPILRMGFWHYEGIAWNTFKTAGDSIAIGCLMAGMRDWLWQKPMYRRCLGSPGFILVPALALILLGAGSHPRIYVVGYTVAMVCIALTIDRCIRLPAGFVGRFLNTRLLMYIGGLSYSIYLWQQLFINRFVKTGLTSFPANLVLALGCALLCYYLVEKPGLRIRKWIEANLSRWSWFSSIKLLRRPSQIV